jgi:hypothetical protein
MTDVAAAPAPAITFASVLGEIRVKAREGELRSLAHVFVELSRHKALVESTLAEISVLGEKDDVTSEEVKTVEAKARRLYQGR